MLLAQTDSVSAQHVFAIDLLDPADPTELPVNQQQFVAITYSGSLPSADVGLVSTGDCLLNGAAVSAGTVVDFQVAANGGLVITLRTTIAGPQTFSFVSRPSTPSGATLASLELSWTPLVTSSIRIVSPEQLDFTVGESISFNFIALDVFNNLAVSETGIVSIVFSGQGASTARATSEVFLNATASASVSTNVSGSVTFAFVFATPGVVLTPSTSVIRTVSVSPGMAIPARITCYV